MKKKGAKSDFHGDMRRDLYQNYKCVLSRVTSISVDDVMRRVVEQPAKRFYVSEERASIVCSMMHKGSTLPGMRPEKRAMFTEIYRRVLMMATAHPLLTLRQLCAIVVYQPAPRFYLAPQSAKVYLYTYRCSKR